MAISALAVATVLVPSSAHAGSGRKQPLRLDQIQVIGTHNSYHLPPRTGLLPDDPLNIAQAPLDVQLEDQNVRSFELDAYNGPDFPVFHGLITDERPTARPWRSASRRSTSGRAITATTFQS